MTKNDERVLAYINKKRAPTKEEITKIPKGIRSKVKCCPIAIGTGRPVGRLQFRDTTAAIGIHPLYIRNWIIDFDLGKKPEYEIND